jgi:mannose-1-phosphate guanylyltransferase / phosphomannomutase
MQNLKTNSLMKKAVIMAGGFGTRLRPLTMSLPKPMVPISNKPMMEHIVNLLKNTGINDIISLLYFQPDKITSYFGDGKNFDVSMNYVHAVADYGTAGSVKNAYKDLNERFIIISGDVLTDFDLNKAIEFHINKKSMATIILTRHQTPLQYGIVITDEEEKIVRFLEKPSWGQVFSDTINTGIYILEPEVLDLIPYQEEFDFSKDLFPTMLAKNMPLFGYVSEGYWRDVGNLNEYRIGQHDSLVGNVKISKDGNKDEKYNNILKGNNVKIGQGVIFEGNVVIGDNVIIEDNAVIINSVIGDNSKIGHSANINESTLWNNVTIGEFTILSNNVICNDVIIGSHTNILENVYIAEKCNIGNKTILNSNIKLWPSKIVQDGATLSISLIQEEKWSRELFTDARISGISNIEINPEFGAKLGSALGMALGQNSSLLASRDADNVSRIMKRSITAGLLSVGVQINDLQTTSIPQTRQELRIGKYAGGFHVRKSPRNPNFTDIIIFSNDGRDISVSVTKSIERYFFGEDIKRVNANQVGKIKYPERTNEIYYNRYTQAVKTEIIKESNFKVLMDYSFGLASTIFPYILGKLNIRAISINDFVDASRFHPDPFMNTNSDETGKIMSSLGYHLGFRLEAGAEKIAVIDDKGIWYSPYRLLTIVTKLFLETNKNREPYKIAVSITATKEIELIAADYNVEVVRIKNSHSGMMEATKDENILFLGGVYGGYIFSEFLLASDGMFTVGKVLEMLAITKFTVAELDELLPKRYQCIDSINCSWDKRGTLLRKIMEYSDNLERQLIEGVKIFFDDNSVLLIPDKETSSFLIYGESKTQTKANEITTEYKELLDTWINNIQQ